YIDLAKKMYDEGYVIKDLNQWSSDWYAAGQTDQTMGYFVSTWGFGDAILSQAAGGEGGATYGKWKVCVGPQAFFWGGTWMTVANRCDNPELVKEFMSFFTTNTEGAQKYAEQQGEFVSNQKAMEAVIAAGDKGFAPVLGGQNQFEVLNVVANQIDMSGAITPYDSTIKNSFNNAVMGYCQGATADVDETINAWATDVASSLPELDYSNFE
ncbi:MAG: extracellular solute-binding protein, partial [Butyrivibrio sp.]|nr:extracellular solute-binding protein [Butyrivibrio sp.]